MGRLDLRDPPRDEDKSRRPGRARKPLRSGPPSPREIQTLQLIADGWRDCDIGVQLGISENTVKSYVKLALDKLDAASRAHAAVIALRRGLIE